MLFSQFHNWSSISKDWSHNIRKLTGEESISLTGVFWLLLKALWFSWVKDFFGVIWNFSRDFCWFHAPHSALRLIQLGFDLSLINHYSIFSTVDRHRKSFILIRDKYWHLYWGMWYDSSKLGSNGDRDIGDLGAESCDHNIQKVAKSIQLMFIKRVWFIF